METAAPSPAADEQEAPQPTSTGRLRVTGTLTVTHADGTVDEEEVVLEGELKEGEHGGQLG